MPKFRRGGAGDPAIMDTEKSPASQGDEAVTTGSNSPSVVDAKPGPKRRGRPPRRIEPTDNGGPVASGASNSED